MSSIFQQFKRINKRIIKAKTKATTRAANKSLSKTRTQFRRDISKATKLKAKVINKRLWNKKATRSNPLKGEIGVGVHWGVPLTEFKPRPKQVKIGRGKGARRYKGVSAMLPNEGRTLIKGAFLAEVKSGKKLVLKRKGKSRSPTYQPKHSIKDIAKAQQRPAQNFLREEFKKQYSNYFKKEIDKLK